MTSNYWVKADAREEEGMLDDEEPDPYLISSLASLKYQPCRLGLCGQIHIGKQESRYLWINNKWRRNKLITYDDVWWRVSFEEISTLYDYTFVTEEVLAITRKLALIGMQPGGTRYVFYIARDHKVMASNSFYGIEVVNEPPIKWHKFYGFSTRVIEVMRAALNAE